MAARTVIAERQAGRAAERPAEHPAGLAVAATGVGRDFGDRAVLAGLDLDIRPGEFVALLGRSGSGKSTLLRILAGLDDGARGDVLVPERRSVVFQDARLLPWADVLDNVVLGLDGDDPRGRGLRAIDEVGLAGHERDWPKTLSGGEAQRAALARALVRDPELLLLDEPFGALDALTRVRMHVLVQELCARHRPAVLLVTHDVDEALLLADRVLVLRDGDLSFDEPVEVRHPRLRSDPAFVALRSRLLAELGVDEIAEGARPAGSTPDGTSESHSDPAAGHRPPGPTTDAAPGDSPTDHRITDRPPDDGPTDHSPDPTNDGPTDRSPDPTNDQERR